MCCNRYILCALSTAFAFWLAFEVLVPSELNHGLNSYYLSFAFGFVGRWDLAMQHAQRAKASMRVIDDPELVDDDLYTTVLMRIGQIHEMLDEDDEAIDVYVNQVMPRMKEELGANDLEIGLVLSDVANIYRKKGDYQTGLEFLAEAQRVYLDGSGGAAKSILLKDNEESVGEMKRLIDVAEEQEAYVTAFVEAARRWHFAGRSRDADADDTCPSMDQCRQKDRFYSPPEFMFVPSIALTLLIPVRFVWEKPSRFRFILACLASSPILFVVVAYWGWVAESYTGKLTTVGLIQRKLGNGENALTLSDEARCSILANPYEETLLVTDEALETFMNALFTYNKLGEEDGVVDSLAEDINALIEASVREPSFMVLGYYSGLAEKYLDRGDVKKSERYVALAEAEAKDLTRAISISAEEEVKKILEPKPVRPLNASLKATTPEDEGDDTNERAEDTSIKVGYI